MTERHLKNDLPVSLRNILSDTQLFAELSEESLEQIASVASVKKISRGSMVFHEQDFAHSFFVVREGKVKVFKLSSEGKEQILMIAGPGDSFAEAALFSGNKYPASAQAIENSRIAVFSRDRFVGLLARNPDLAMNLIGRLSGLLRKMTRLVEELSLADVTTRLAHYLAESVGPEAKEPVKIHLAEKKAVLAAQLGTIPETLSRSFARLAKQGMISIKGPDIELLNLERLRELAGQD